MDDITGECITSEILSWRPKIRILIALLHHAHASESLIKKVHKLNDSIQSVAAKRNKYIHGSCGLAIIDSELLPITKYATIKGSLKIDEIEYDPVRMRAIIDEINKLKQQAEAIMQGIFELQLQQ